MLGVAFGRQERPLTSDHDHNRRETPAGTPSDSVTWAGLLGSCVEFARSAITLPESGEAGKFRRSVPAIISLHAVAHALADLDRLTQDDIPLALDRADMLIEEAAGELLSIWGDDVPEALAPFLIDAVEALDRAGGEVAGDADHEKPESDDSPALLLEWVVDDDSAELPHPGELALALASAGLPIDVHLALPGVRMFTGAVVCVADLSAAGDAAGEIAAVLDEFLGETVDGPFEAAEPRQVYRQFDFARGGPVRDVIAAASAGEQPGQPLLVPVLISGEVQPVPMPHRKREPLEPIPVVLLGG